jgi:hypothetical protein
MTTLRAALALLFGFACFLAGAYLPRACAAQPKAPIAPVPPVTCDTRLAEAEASLRQARWALDVEKRALKATCDRLHDAGEYSVICDNGAR